VTVVHAIAGVSTSITAFVGRTASGPTDRPQPVYSFADFERTYGGLSLDCPLTYAVRHFFLNGGNEAVIARIAHRDASGTAVESAPITDADLADPSLEAQRRGLWLLDQADLVNLICIPPLAPGVDVASSTWDTAIRYATRRRAFVVVDPPSAWITAAQASAGVDQFVTRDSHAALYFPRLRVRDPLQANQLDTYAPCGAVAGIYARTDATRGVWKSPAGNDAALHGVTGLSVSLAERDSGPLNRQAINCLRNFPLYGNVVWGARTLAGADALASEWKYVPVRRTALFIEESLYRGTQWAVFEPNDEPLWAELRLNIGAFMQNLFRQGAFQGRTPREAYFVKCDKETTTQNDINLGVVNILVGFAPLKPAEFVFIFIQQIAGQIAT
jgi:phage tail sheath protein FI